MTNGEGRFIFAIGAIIENSNANILLIKRSPTNLPGNIWDIVGGGVEQFEDPFDALTREIKEETGIEEFEIVKALDVFHCFEKNVSKEELIGITFWCKTSTKEVTLSHEHVDYRWCKPLEALKMSEHKDVTSTIVQYINEKKKLGYTIE